MKLERQLDELVLEEVIEQSIADNISSYFENKRNAQPSTILVTFGILGAILGGLGIIMILAHNWDDLGVFAKSVIAFVPLLLGQFLCGISLFKKKGNIVWRESSSAFLFISIGACIALISQTYNIPGELAPFLATWMLLGLPLVYLMRSSSASILYIAGITYYGITDHYSFYGATESYYFWLMLLAIIPFIVRQHRTDSKSNFLTITYWILSLSVIITLGTVANKTGILMYIAYLSLFGVLYSYGHSKWMNSRTFFGNAPRLLGGAGMLGMLLYFSFDNFWKLLRSSHYWFRNANINWDTAMYSPEFISCALLTVIAVLLIVLNNRSFTWKKLRPLSFVPFVFILTFSLGYYWDYSQLIINLMILVIAILTILEGAEKDHLGILNKGLAIIAILASFRFFDTQLSFVLKGVMFLVVGLGFFAANYLVVKRRKKRINQNL